MLEGGVAGETVLRLARRFQGGSRALKHCDTKSAREERSRCVDDREATRAWPNVVADGPDDFERGGVGH